MALNTSNQAVCNLAARPVGTYNFTATFAGDVRTLGSSTIGDYGVVVVANVVHASGVGVSATSIYPVVDTYRDTIAIRGTRDEPHPAWR